jgi:hypothetical protein
MRPPGYAASTTSQISGARTVLFDAKPSEFELTFPDPMHELYTSDGDPRVSKPLHAKHRTYAQLAPFRIDDFSGSPKPADRL